VGDSRGEKRIKTREKGTAGVNRGINSKWGSVVRGGSRSLREGAIMGRNAKGTQTRSKFPYVNASWK